MAPKNFYQQANDKLVEIVNATTGNSFLYVDEKTGTYLESKGWVERNREITNEAGEIATRATEAGIAKVNIPVKTESADDKAIALAEKKERKVMSFVIEDVPVSKPARTANRKSGIPFDLLNPGQSIFFADDGSDSKFLAKMRLKAYSATAKFAVEKKDAAGNSVMREIKRGPNAGTVVPKMVNTREFVADKAERKNEDGTMTPGVRVGRLS